MFESAKVLAVMQCLPLGSLAAADVEWGGGEPCERPSPRLVVLAFPIRDRNQFLRQHSANARAGNSFGFTMSESLLVASKSRHQSSGGKAAPGNGENDH